MKQIAIFGGGCFWCTEAVFTQLKGISSVLPGYAGGATKNPTYEQVSSGRTGHVEVIKVEFDSSAITYHDLLTVFFGTHDPTTLNRQGNDVGTQYRSIIFYTNDQQQQEAVAFIEAINRSTTKGKNIVTEIKPLIQFYEAEDYHQQYYRNNSSQPYCQLIINPKLEKVQKDFSELLASHENN